MALTEPWVRRRKEIPGLKDGSPASCALCTPACATAMVLPAILRPFRSNASIRTVGASIISPRRGSALARRRGSVHHAAPDPFNGARAESRQPPCAAPHLERVEQDRAQDARIDRHPTEESQPESVEHHRANQGLDQVLGQGHPPERGEAGED